MLRNYIVRKFVKIAYLSALYLSLFFITIQLFRIGFILTGLSPLHTLTFLSLWMAFYFIYFLPDGIIISTLYNIFYLKEKKLVHVIYSFGISPLRMFLYFVIGALSLFLVGVISAFFLHEEDLTFARNILLVHYQERIVEALPEKTFYNMGDFVIYVGEKEKGKLKDVFFKYEDFTVIAREAIYEGKGRFSFNGGSLVVKMEDKYFITFFDHYVLDTIKIPSPERREIRIAKERIYNVVNTVSGLLMSFICFFVGSSVLKYYTHIYYISALFIILREIFMFTFKLYLF